MTDRSPKDHPLRGLALVGVIGIDLASTTLGGFWLGRSLDRWLDSEPAFLITGVLVGLAVGIFSVALLVKAFIGEG